MSTPRLAYRGGLLPILVLAALSFGCVAAGPRPPTAAELAGRNAKVVVVAPLNVASSLPVEIESSSEIVAVTLVEYLEAHGKKVQRLGFRGGRDLWIHATTLVSRSKQRRTFENAASVYAREIAKQIEYDVLIIPTLYIQNGRVHSRIVRWDGAREPLRIEGREVLRKRDKAFHSISANVRAASMMAAVFSADGSQIQSKNRGLQVIEHIQLREKNRGITRADGSWHFVWNDPPLGDPVKIRAGIASALSPFLPELAPVEQAGGREGVPAE